MGRSRRAAIGSAGGAPIRAPSDVTYVEFMGKDNVAFHTVSFPVTIMGSGEPWKLVDRLKAFNWVTWYGGKFCDQREARHLHGSGA